MFSSAGETRTNNTSVRSRTCYQLSHPGSPRGPSKPSAYARAEPPCVLCEQPHRLWHCDKFKRLSPTNRLDIVLRYNLCHNCLLPTHQTSDCGKQSVCSVKSCGKKHTMYIHINEDKGNVVNSQTDVVQMSALSDKEVYMPIVAVTLNGTIPYWIPVPVTRSVRIDWSEIWASKVNKKCID